jgi:fatty acid desaturase
MRTSPTANGRTDLPPSLLERSTMRGLLPVFRTWSLIATIFVLVGVLGQPFVWMIGAILVGVLQYSLIILAHHSQHFDLSPRVGVNEFVARWLLHAPLVHDLTASRRIHMRHHARVGRDDDADRFFYDLRLHHRQTGSGLVRWTVSMFLGGVIAPGIRKLWRLDWNREALAGSGATPASVPAAGVVAIGLVQTVIAVAAWLITGAWFAYALLWLAPMVTVAAGLSAIRSMLEHADRATTPQRMLSFVSSPLERFLLGPANMNHHWEHHRFISVPFYHLPAVRRLCLERNDYAPGILVASYRRRFLELCRVAQPAGEGPGHRS